MMTSLFSIFDPSTNLYLNLNWISSITNMLIICPISYWLKNSRIKIFYMNLFNKMKMELKIIFNKKFNSLNMIFFISLFMNILMNNFMGLFPYVFTSSSHMIFSISFSLPLWIGLMLFMWMKNINFMFSHMIPQSTPIMLMPFMVIIETISNFIRPLTLSIRLTANMISGHLLITLLSNSALNNWLIMMMIIMIQIILLTLEFSVSIIQAYVFTILSSLYTKETNYE